MSEPVHGRYSTYINHRCRCVECRADMATYRQQWKARHAGNPANKPHGDYVTYCNYRCRCQPCRDAWAAYMRDHMRNLRQRRSAS